MTFFFSCFFDGVKGNVMELLAVTIPQDVIIVMNCILYFLTWLKIRHQQPILKSMPGYKERVVERAHKAANNMILLIVAFLVQWIATTIYGIWRALGIPMPLTLLQTAMISVNMGGILNCVVFTILRSQKMKQMASPHLTITHRPQGSPLPSPLPSPRGESL